MGIRLHKILKDLFSLYLLFSAMGCATWSGEEGKTQGLFIESNPANAKIYLNDNLVGVSPQWVRVPRQARAQIRLEHGGKTKIIPLESYFRWDKSFFSNLVFLGAWPIALTVDLISGEAWSFRELGEVQLGATGRGKKVKLPVDRSTLLAPVIAGNLLQSQEAEEQLKKTLHKQGYRFDLTDSDRDLLNRYDYSFKTKGSGYDRSQIMSLMPQRNFASFELVNKGEASYLEGYVLDKLSGKKRNKKIPVRLRGETARKKFGEFFGIIPNSLGVEFSNRKATFSPLSNPDIIIEGKSVADGSFFTEAVKVISAFHLGYSSGPRYSRTWHGEMSFVPAGNVSLDSFEYKDFPQLQGHTFQRAYISGGYGVHFGLSSRYGGVYFDLVPQIAYIDIQWKKDGSSLHFTNWSVEISTELGYEYFFDNHWYAKLFSRGSSEPIELWEEIFAKTADYNEKLDSSTNLYSGIQFGYFLDSWF